MNLNSSLKDASFFRNKGENFHVDGYNSLNYVSEVPSNYLAT